MKVLDSESIICFDPLRNDGRFYVKRRGRGLRFSWIFGQPSLVLQSTIYYVLLFDMHHSKGSTCWNSDLSDQNYFFFFIPENISLLLALVSAAALLLHPGNPWHPFYEVTWVLHSPAIFSLCYNDKSIGLTEFNYINIIIVRSSSWSTGDCRVSRPPIRRPLVWSPCLHEVHVNVSQKNCH